MQIAINGIGVVGGFGCGIEDLRRRLEAGTDSAKVQVSEKVQEKPGLQAYCADTSRLNSIMPKRALRRMDHFARLAVLASCLAIEDAGFSTGDPAKAGVVVATGYGATKATFSFLDTVFDNGDACASPTFFASSVHNAAAAYISILTQAAGPTITVSQFEMSIPAGLLTAAGLLEQKKVDFVLFGGVDEICPVLNYSWYRLFSTPQSPTIYPFELNRQSAIPGEGAVFFVLSRDSCHPAKYGVIAEVMLGNIDKNPTVLSSDIPLVAGLDGHEECARRYIQHIPPGSTVAAYAHLYGSLPVGPGFDLAVAANALKDGYLFAVPHEFGDYLPWRIIREAQPLGASPVCCIKFDRYGNCGVIMLSR